MSRVKWEYKRGQGRGTDASLHQLFLVLLDGHPLSIETPMPFLLKKTKSYSSVAISIQMNETATSSWLGLKKKDEEEEEDEIVIDTLYLRISRRRTRRETV